MAEKQNFFALWMSFNDMLTPRLIEFFYIIGLGTVMLVSVVMMTDNIGGGILVLLFGSILWRIWCEFMIVVFKINENIQKIANRYEN